MNIGLVVEGPSDRLVLKAVLERLIPGDHRWLNLQPLEPLGGSGAGWKGVRRWCFQSWAIAGSSLDLLLSPDTGPSIDLLVIHVDADIFDETDLQEGSPLTVPVADCSCPPIEPTTEFLASVIRGWLNRERLPPNVVLAIPAQDTETWVFTALFPEHKLCLRVNHECRHMQQDHPGWLLTLKEYGKYLQRKDGNTVKKPSITYRDVLAPVLAEKWHPVRALCTRARRFEEDVMGAIGSTPAGSINGSAEAIDSHP